MHVSPNDTSQHDDKMVLAEKAVNMQKSGSGSELPPTSNLSQSIL